MLNSRLDRSKTEIRNLLQRVTNESCRPIDSLAFICSAGPRLHTRCELETVFIPHCWHGYDALRRQVLSIYSRHAVKISLTCGRLSTDCVANALVYQQEEEINALQKRIAALGSDVEQARVQLQTTTDKLESTNRQLANVSTCECVCVCVYRSIRVSRSTDRPNKQGKQTN